MWASFAVTPMSRSWSGLSSDSARRDRFRADHFVTNTATLIAICAATGRTGWLVRKPRSEGGVWITLVMVMLT